MSEAKGLVKFMKKIAVFNHKGGVSKTTTSFNLGYGLAKKGKTVLLVDADSQCNLSLYAMGFQKYSEYCEKKNTNNIYDCLVPAYKSQPILIKAADCYKLTDKLFLLPGNLDFAENEVQLGIAMQLSSALGAMGNLPGALNYLVEKTGEKYKIDYVIFDMNPSLSAINKDVLISSDYFIVPMSPDYFSIMAVNSLSRILPLWEKWAKSAREVFSDAIYKIPDRTPIFLGYTVNDFNLSNGVPQKSFQVFMDRISKSVLETLFIKLEEEGMTFSKEKYEKAYKNMLRKLSSCNKEIAYNDPFCIAQISNFNKLIAISNEKSQPIFDIELNNPTDGQKRTLSWFKKLYDAMAERVIELTDEK